MKITRVILILVGGLCLVSIGLQIMVRRQTLNAFDMHNIGAIGNKEAYHQEFNNKYDWETNFQQLDKVQKYLVPLGPIFCARNRSTVRKVFEIADDYHGKEISEDVLKDAARRISNLTLSPL